MKFVLQQNQGLRTLSGALLDTFIVAAGAADAQAMQERGRVYADLAKRRREVRQAGAQPTGPPHFVVFRGLLETPVQRGREVGARNLTTLEAYLGQYAAIPPDDEYGHIKTWRVDAPYKSEARRISPSFGADIPREARMAASSPLIQTGADHKHGRAAPLSQHQRPLPHPEVLSQARRLGRESGRMVRTHRCATPT